MKRASSVGTRGAKQGPPLRQNQVSFPANNQSSLEQSEFERVEGLHIECHEIEHELKALTMKMSDFLSKQTIRKVEEKATLQEPKALYDNLREVLRKFQALTSGWDQLFQQMTDQKSMQRTRYEKEIERLKKGFEYQIKSMEYQQKSILQENKQEFTRREQEIYHHFDAFAQELETHGRSWRSNLKDLEFLKEQVEHSKESHLDQQNTTIENLEERVSEIFDQFVIPFEKHSGRAEPKRIHDFERHRFAGIGNPPLSARNLIDIPKMISPIHNLVSFRNRNLKSTREELDGQKSARDEHQVPLTKRTEDISVTSSKFYEELKMYDKNDPQNAEIENSRISIQKHDSMWDSRLEDDDEESSDNLGEVVKALEILSRNKILEQDNLTTLAKMISNANDHQDSSSYLELFAQMMKMKNKLPKEATPNSKNNDMPLVRKPTSATITGTINLDSELPRRNLKHLNTESNEMHDTEMDNPELACTTPSNQRFMFPGIISEGDEKLAKTIESSRLSSNKSKERKPQVVVNLIDSKKKKKKAVSPKRGHVGLLDLIEAKNDISLMMSPLAMNEENIFEQRELHHVNLDDILSAPSQFDEILNLGGGNKSNKKGPLKSDRRNHHQQDENLKPSSQFEKKTHSQSNPSTFRAQNNVASLNNQPTAQASGTHNQAGNQIKIKIFDELRQPLQALIQGNEIVSEDSMQRKRIQELHNDDERLESDRPINSFRPISFDKKLAPKMKNEAESSEEIERDKVDSSSFSQRRSTDDPKLFAVVKRPSRSSSSSIDRSETSSEQEYLSTPNRTEAYLEGEQVGESGKPSEEITQRNFRRRCSEVQRKQPKSAAVTKATTSLSCENRCSTPEVENLGFLENKSTIIPTNTTNPIKKFTKNSYLTNNSLRSLLIHNQTEVGTAPGYIVNLIAFSERSEPIICPLKLIGTSLTNALTAEEMANADFLNASYPPARGHLIGQRSHFKIPRRQQGPGLKGMETADTANGLRNFNTNSSISYNHHITTKDVKNFTGMASLSLNASKITNPMFTKSRINH